MSFLHYNFATAYFNSQSQLFEISLPCMFLTILYRETYCTRSERINNYNVVNKVKNTQNHTQFTPWMDLKLSNLHNSLHNIITTTALFDFT